MSSDRRYRWVILNQTQSTAHQDMLARLSERLGPTLLVTGTPYPTAEPSLDIRVGPAYDRRSMARRVVSWVGFTSSALCRTLRLPGRPFVLAVTNPPLLPWVAWLLHRVSGMPYGLLIWDIYPDHIVAMGWLTEQSPLVRLWRAANRRALTDASVVITLGESMAAALAGGLGPGQPSPDIAVVPNWADIDAIRPIPKAENAFAQSHGQVGVLTVMYSGNMGASHGLEPLMEVADRLRDRDGIRFMIIGGGAGRPVVEQAVRRRRLERVEVLPYQPWDVVRLSLATADIAVVIQAPGTEHLSLPSKLYTSLAAGSAVLALTSPSSDLARLVRDIDAGVVCPPDEPDAIASEIRGLAEDPARLARMRTNARRAAESRFSADVVFEQLLHLLEPCISESRPEARR